MRRSLFKLRIFTENTHRPYRKHLKPVFTLPSQKYNSFVIELQSVNYQNTIQIHITVKVVILLVVLKRYSVNVNKLTVMNI